MWLESLALPLRQIQETVCPKESFCKVDGCTSNHSTFLHPKTKQPASTGKGETKQEKDDPENQKSEGDQINPAKNSYIKSNSTASSLVTGLAVVPVQVKAKRSFEVIRTYAFLDLGSSTTFCTDAIIKKLGANSTKTKLSLTNMQGKNAPVECSVVNLEIADLAGNCDINPPIVYSRSSLPVPKEAIGIQEDVNR